MCVCWNIAVSLGLNSLKSSKAEMSSINTIIDRKLHNEISSSAEDVLFKRVEEESAQTPLINKRTLWNYSQTIGTSGTRTHDGH